MKVFFVTLIIALLTAFTEVSAAKAKPANPQKKCAKSQFKYYTPNTGTVCLPKGGCAHPINPPPPKDCPAGYEWHKFFHICVPLNPPTTTHNPKCPKGKWDKKHQCCWQPHTPPPPTPSKRATLSDSKAKRSSSKLKQRKVSAAKKRGSKQKKASSQKSKKRDLQTQKSHIRDEA